MERLRRLAERWMGWRDERRIAAALRALERSPQTSLRDYGRQWAYRYADRIALIEPERQITFAAWNRRANQYARWARSVGLAKGDVVAAAFPDSAELFTCWTGLARAGVVTALLNPAAPQDVLAKCLRASGARHILVQAQHAARLGRGAALLESAPRLLCFGECEDAGAADLPRLDLVLKGFSGGDIPGEDCARLTPDDACLIRFDAANADAIVDMRLSHRDVLREMLSCVAGFAHGRALVFGAPEADASGLVFGRPDSARARSRAGAAIAANAMMAASILLP